MREQINERIGSALSISHHLYGNKFKSEQVAFCFMASYSSFMDAAGKPDAGPEEWCVVAGFISTVDRWEDFQASWNDLLKKHSIPYLQMSALHARKKPYLDPKWNDESYMASFLAESGEMIRGHVLHWGADVVKNSDFEQAQRDVPGLSKFTNAYGLCGTAVALRLQMPWLRFDFNRMEKPHIEHFFEEGDAGLDGIGRAFKRAGMAHPIVRPGKPRRGFPNVQHFVQFQASDWLAFETRKMVKKYWPSKPEIRKPLKALLRNVHGEAKVWTYDDLMIFCERKRKKGEME